MQSHGITLSFHCEMADSSRELVGPDVTAAVTFESYPRFIKGRFPGLRGSRDQKIHCRFQACSLHIIEVARGQDLLEPPQKVVEFLELTGTSGDYVIAGLFDAAPCTDKAGRDCLARRWPFGPASIWNRKGHRAELTNC